MSNLENYHPTPIEDLPDDIRKIAVKAQGLRQQNSQMIGEIESLGGGVDVLSAQLEHFMYSLVALGVITERNMWEISLSWETGLRPQVKSSLEAIRQIHTEARRKAATPKLIVPGR